MTSPRVRILAPVSDRKQTGGTTLYGFDDAQDDRSLNRYLSLTKDRREALMAFLSSINGMGHAELVLRLSGERLTTTCETNLAFRRAPLMPVHERDIGPLFSALAAETLDAAGARRLKRRLLVLCPLLGLLAPTDWIPEYRCPVGAQVPALSTGSLHAFWKPRISTLLNRLCRDHVVYSFLPARLGALWERKARGSHLINVGFLRRRPRELIHEHAGARRAAGELIRHLVETEAGDPESLTGWKSSAGHAFLKLEQVDADTTSLLFVR